MYSIVDIETTGTSAPGEKITEIAIFVFDGERIVDEFVTLINPEKKIPYRITQLTGITDKMVEDAPRFCEVARKIVEITENTVFVAHNVGFDYGFVRNEFKSLGYEYQREKLCTVRLSRKLVPGLASYSLGNLCQSLAINIKNRHRAAGDALATVKLFQHLLAIDSRPMQVNLKGTNSSLNPDIVHKLPEEPGVYYFHNKEGAVIYIGKSLCIRDRIKQHLINETTQKALEMKYAVQDVSYELTGSDLVAQLLESEEIKNHMPIYNRAQRRIGFNLGLYLHVAPTGFHHLRIEKLDNAKQAITSFNSVAAAKRYLFDLCEQHSLCQKLCGLYKTEGACFQHTIGSCLGACLGLEPHETYNARVEAALAPIRFDNDNFFIIDKGRRFNECSVVQVHGGCYVGYGYIDMETGYSTISDLQECITPHQDTRDIRQIIRSYLRLHKYQKFIAY